GARRSTGAAARHSRPTSTSMLSPKRISRQRSPCGSIRHGGAGVGEGVVNSLAARSRLLGEEGIHVLERFEFQRVARRIEEEHGGLLAHFALEADVGLDDELGA